MSPRQLSQLAGIGPVALASLRSALNPYDVDRVHRARSSFSRSCIAGVCMRSQTFIASDAAERYLNEDQKQLIDCLAVNTVSQRD